MLLRLLLVVAVQVAPVAAGPVVCTTTLEAPDPRAVDAAPVELTRCVPVETTRELINRRFFTWTSPYARGVDLMHQVTDLFGIAMAGPDGDRLMGFGFSDQTVVWDASAISNTMNALLEEQSPAVPLRTLDLTNGFTSSLALEGIITEATSQHRRAPVRPLW